MEIKDKDMKYVRQKFKKNFIPITYENMNIKWNEQAYGENHILD